MKIRTAWSDNIFPQALVYRVTASKAFMASPGRSTRGREIRHTLNHPQSDSLNVLHPSVELAG
nr:hypothetical protein [Pantoea ananatis]